MDKSKQAKELLLPAIRQYRHNNSDDFIAGYETGETESIVAFLLKEIERKDEALRHIQSFCGDEMIGETDILERVEELNIPEKPGKDFPRPEYQTEGWRP